MQQNAPILRPRCSEHERHTEKQKDDGDEFKKKVLICNNKNNVKKTEKSHGKSQVKQITAMDIKWVTTEVKSKDNRDKWSTVQS